MTGTHLQLEITSWVRRIVLLPALISLSLPLVAHGSSVMRFDRIDVSDGLSQSSVLAVAQDQAGFLWFATEAGVDRYDGFEFTNYGRERGNPDALASDFARDLHVASDGSLWVATDGGGLSRWAPETGKFRTWRHNPRDEDSLASDRIRSIASDVDGNIWIGFRGEGLGVLDPKTGDLKHFTRAEDDPATLSHNDVYAIEVDADGNVWVGTNAGLNRYDKRTNKVQRIGNGMENVTVRSLLLASDGTLWAGTSQSGVYLIDVDNLATTQQTPRTSGLASDRVNVLYEDNDGRIWAGTNKGLSLWQKDAQEFETFRNDPTDPSSLSGDAVFSVFQDRGGVLWIGTLTGGVSRWNPRSWSFGHSRLESPDGGELRSTNITSFTEDSDRSIWVGTFGGGISIVDEHGEVQRAVTTNSEQPLSDDRVMALTTDSHGNVWAGTMTGGLNRIDVDTGAVTTYRTDPDNDNSLPANGVMALLETSNGDLWIGTFGGGVSRFDPRKQRFTNYTHDPENPNSLSGKRATSIAQAGDGTIWVGTDGGGLNWFDASSGIWQSIVHDANDPSSLSANTVYALHVDDRDRLWVGTREGLDLVVRQSSSTNPWHVVSIAGSDGQALKAVYGIQSERNGRLWLSTNHGLISYDPASQRMRNFHKTHGLQDEEFNFGASFKSSSGTMYFGGGGGFNAFNPSQLEFNATPPPIALTSLSIMNEPLASHRPHKMLDRLNLGYKDYVVTFAVAALDFAAPEKNTYAYRLVGLDENWVELGNERRITYTNLHGGEYTLQIKAANSDGVWNQSGITIPIVVAFPPWKTWWAYSLYVLAVGLVILAIWRRQQNKLRRESDYRRRLEREVHNRTRQLNDRNQDLKHANARLIEASTTDPLTGLRNRRYLYEQISKDVDLVLRHYRDGSETLSATGNNDLLFLMVDLDNFKPVNDSCGHEAGDELLLQIRDVLLDACRSSDDVIRWGGDEFLIVARETNRKFAATLAERIRAGLAQRVFPLGNGQMTRITTSIGYASFPFLKERPELLTWEEVLSVADTAMYEAKQKRNAWTGIEGLEWDGDGDELCRAIKTAPGDLAEEGHIRAVESIEDVAKALA
ncbi:MAG: two-component regulator propeller domain-containing protein [Woeseiaceae bacterium]|nr:two-component regulator propeller domain-containing protein [Woeseiaceae bacterium]